MEDAGHTVDGGTRGETEAVKAAIEESVEDKQNGNAEDAKPDLKRKGTMQETIEVRKTAKKRKKIAHIVRLRFQVRYYSCSVEKVVIRFCVTLFAIVTWKFKLC